MMGESDVLLDRILVGKDMRMFLNYDEDNILG